MASSSAGASSTSTDSECFEFLLENVDAFGSHDSVRSPSFTCGRFRFRLLVYPKGTVSSKVSEGRKWKDESLSAFIEADPPDCLVEDWIFHGVTFSITLVNGLSIFRSITRKDTWTFQKNMFLGKAGIDRGWVCLCRLSTVMDKEAGWLGPNNSLLFRASASVELSDAAWEAMLTPEAKARFSLSSDFSMLWSSGWQSDVTLRAGGCDLKAHTLVLTARSPVFKQMFSSGMAETSTKIVDISDIASDVLNHMCSFMYSGEVEEAVWDNDDATCGLMRAASKYELTTLTELCASRAAKRVCVENVAEWLRAASELNAEKLKAHCITFAVEHLSDVQATPGWERLMQDKNMVFEVAPLLLKSISPPPKKRARQG